VQELTAPGLDELRASGLDDHLPHSFLRTGFGGEGTGLWSRFALSDTTSQPGFGFEVLSARAQLPDGCRPWLFSVHLEPPWPRPSQAWTVELPRFAALLQGLPGGDSIVAAGDFNATFDHPQFRAMLKGGLHDAGEQTGRRRLLTYPAHRLRPLLGIDHILLRSATALNARTVAIPGSDHLGVLAEIRLTG
jgi:endonuclease/exonuclease/phosphatase (EEP) superfamily protein YafD